VKNAKIPARLEKSWQKVKTLQIETKRKQETRIGLAGSLPFELALALVEDISAEISGV
jgi:hypothetical protein